MTHSSQRKLLDHALFVTCIGAFKILDEKNLGSIIYINYIYLYIIMKIAFLFLTINDINFPEIWEYYFKNNYDKISIYCHPKYPENIKTPWLKKNIIKATMPMDL